ncbi:MAG: ABC transporter permease [Thaumarchaeota archaeon]|nr:ABC transporter permease [Nitrososphaerota archaeon]|tara:strand:- start:6817 stop:7968 length:1152 start_codon:yes stop_codon:yes gene_type:complete
MKDILRDRRTLFATVIIPILLIPLMTFGIPLLFSSTEQQIVEQTQYIAIINYESSEEFTKLIDGSRSLRVVVIDKPIDEAIRNGTIAAGVEIPRDFDNRILNEQNVNITIYYDASSRTSNVAYSKIMQFLSMYSKDTVDERLVNREINPQILRPIQVYASDVATKDEVSGYLLSLILPPLLSIIVATGGMNAAIDLTVGEKERHTLEALLVTSTNRRDLITGKFLAVFSTTLVSIAFIMLSLSGSVGYLSTLAVQQMPIFLTLQTSIIVFMILSLMAIMIASLGMAIASFAKSFKEANNYLTPMLFLIVILSFGSYGLSIEDIGLIPFLVPILNVTLVIQEVLVNNLNILHLVLTVTSTLVISIILISIASWIFHKESLLFRA